MDERFGKVALAAAKNSDLVDKLDQVLKGPNDRAFVVCSYEDCTHNVQGRCTIFAVQDVPKMKAKEACEQYQPKQAGSI